MKKLNRRKQSQQRNGSQKSNSSFPLCFLSGLLLKFPRCILVFAFSLLFSVSCVLGSNVTFSFVNFLGQATTNVTFTVTPTSPQTNGIGSLAPTDAITTNTANASSLALNGFLSGSYTFRHNSTFLTFTVPDDTSTYNLTNLITPLALPGVNAMFTRFQSDARYLQASNGFTYTHFTNGTTGAQIVANVPFTNTFNRHATIFLTLTNNNTQSLGGFYITSGGVQQPPLFLPMDTTITSNTISFDMGPWDSCVYSNLASGILNVSTNKLGLWN